MRARWLRVCVCAERGWPVRHGAAQPPCCFSAVVVNSGVCKALRPAEHHAQRLTASHGRYQHADMADLEAKLQQASGARVKLIATDGVRHMHHRGHDLSGVVIRARGFASPVLPGHVMQVILTNVSTSVLRR